MRLLLLALAVLLLAPSASATTLRYTFELEAHVNPPNDGIEFSTGDLFRFILDVGDKDLDPDPRRGSFASTSIRIEADQFTFLSGPHQPSSIPTVFVIVGPTSEFRVMLGGLHMSGEFGGMEALLRGHTAVQELQLGLSGEAGVFESDALPKLIDLERMKSTFLPAIEVQTPRDGAADAVQSHFFIGSRFVSASVTVVPEPASLALLALGMLGVVCFVRRRVSGLSAEKPT